MSAFEEEKGLVGKIRAATDSESFDLAGYSEARVRDLVEKAFSTPLEMCREMVKLTFTIGGGKLVRSRYDDSMSKWIISALKEIGFNEDRSAACEFSCQGSFKQQHDTGQNLKTVAVFPFVSCAKLGGAAGPVEELSENSQQVTTKDSLIVSADFSTFCEIINSKTESWSERKRVLKVLQDSSAKFEEQEAALIRGEMLSPAEQSLYDMNSGCDSEKITWVQGEIKSMVDRGKLTKAEKQQLLTSIDENIEMLQLEIDEAVTSQQEKKVSLLMGKKGKIEQRRKKVEDIAPIIHKLKKSAEIQKIYIALQNIYALEDRGRSMSLTLADLKKIEPKFELEQQLTQLQQMSRCWFESDEEFELRCNELEREVKSKIAKKAPGGVKKKGAGVSCKSGSTASSTSSWNTKSIKGTHAAGSNRNGGGRASNTAGGFAAAFGSDSDSEDD